MKLELNEDGLLDVVIDNGVVHEDTIKTALLASLLLNRRADPEDELPYGYKGKGGALTDDRQGWVGDILDSQGRLVGSKLWLLDQELATEETVQRGKQYIRECTEWSIEDGYVSRITIKHEWITQTRADLFASFYFVNGDVWHLRVDYETGAVYEL